MFELVPSKYMREYFKKVGFKFSDFQKATLIWNARGKTWDEILSALRKLAETTEDAKTRKQVLERINYEEKALDTFKMNPSGKYVFVVEDHDDKYSCGFFADYQLAEKYVRAYAKEYGHRCSIEKQQIIKTPEEYSGYEGMEVGEVFFNKVGEKTSVWSLELREEKELLEDDRFEDQFIKLPFPLETGSLVKNVVNGTYGVTSHGRKDWNQHFEELEKRGFECDFSDVQVVTYELMEDGCWAHEHINPIYLEPEEPPYIQNDRKNNAFRYGMEMMGEYFRNEENGDTSCKEKALKATREYVKICRDLKDSWEKTVAEAKTPEEIMM